MMWTMLKDITFRTFQDLEPVGHVKLGKILGISTRMGNMVYISDWMEATEIMLEIQEKSENTRIFVGSHLWKRLLQQLVFGIVMLSA